MSNPIAGVSMHVETLESPGGWWPVSLAYAVESNKKQVCTYTFTHEQASHIACTFHHCQAGLVVSCGLLVPIYRQKVNLDSVLLPKNMYSLCE